MALDRWQQRCLRADNTSVIVVLLEPSADPNVDDVTFDDNDGVMSKSSSVVSVATTVELTTSSLNLKPKTPQGDVTLKLAEVRCAAEASGVLEGEAGDGNSNDLSRGRNEWAMEVEGVDTDLCAPASLAQRSRVAGDRATKSQSEKSDLESLCNTSHLAMPSPLNISSGSLRSNSKVNAGVVASPHKTPTANSKRRPRALSPLPSVKVVLKNIVRSSPDLKMQLQQVETLRLNGKSHSASSVLDSLFPTASALVASTCSKATKNAMEACQQRMQQQQQRQVEQARSLRNHAVLSPIVPTVPNSTPQPSTSTAAPSEQSPATRRRHNSSTSSSTSVATPRKQSYAQILSGNSKKRSPPNKKSVSSTTPEKSKHKSSETSVVVATTSNTRSSTLLSAVKRWKPVKRLRKIASQKSTTTVKVSTPRDKKRPGASDSTKRKRATGTGSGSSATQSSRSRKKLSLQKAKDILSGTASSAHRNKCRRKLTLSDIKKRLALTLTSAAGASGSTASQSDLVVRPNGKILRQDRVTTSSSVIFSTKSCHNLRMRQHERRVSSGVRDASNNSSNTSSSLLLSPYRQSCSTNEAKKQQHGRNSGKARNKSVPSAKDSASQQQLAVRTRAHVASGKPQASNQTLVGVEAVALQIDVLTAEMMETCDPAQHKPTSGRANRQRLKLMPPASTSQLGIKEGVTSSESGTSSPKQGVSAKSPLRSVDVRTTRFNHDSNITVALPNGLSGMKRKMSASDDTGSAPGSGDESSEVEAASVAPPFAAIFDRPTSLSQVSVEESSASVRSASASDPSSRKARHVHGLIRHIQQRKTVQSMQQHQDAILKTLTSSSSVLSAMTPAATKCSMHTVNSHVTRGKVSQCLTTEDLSHKPSSTQPLSLPRRRHSNVGVRSEHATRSAVKSLAEANHATAALHLHGVAVSPSSGKREQAGSDLAVDCQGRVAAAWTSPGMMTRKQRKQQKSPHKASLSSVT